MWCNKSIWTSCLSVVIVVYMTRSVSTQTYPNYDLHSGFQPSAWTGRPEHIYMGAGSRFVEPITATSYPLHYYNPGLVNAAYQQYHGGYQPFQSPYYGQAVASHVNPTTSYSGYYYAQGKAPPQLSKVPVSPSYYSYQPPSRQHATPSTTSTFLTYNKPYVPPAPHRPLPLASSQTSSNPDAKSDTYREAVDMFSEVVRKLAKGKLLNLYRSPSSVLQLSNGILGSSGGFPSNLDHIMGPEFISRAEKLYNKIIIEQNERLRAQSLLYRGSAPTPSYLARNMVMHVPTTNPVYEGIASGGSEYESDDSLETSESRNSNLHPAPYGREASGEISSPQETVSYPASSPNKGSKSYNPNNYAEHPLPYQEYEDLIKDIAAYDDYKK